jgi:hypothetical protein
VKEGREERRERGVRARVRVRVRHGEGVTHSAIHPKTTMPMTMPALVEALRAWLTGLGR